MIRRNDKTYRMSDEQAIVCPARIRGFSLADKTFAFFLVDKVTDIQWREDALEKLEIKQDFKDTINDLVKQHDRNSGGLKAEFKDIIEGKGLGLVFLLAGAPGLGKTLTAEVVAEHNRKPLYAITSGEIDLDGYGVDQGIRKIFDRAKAWDAHLLLDEADVFLAERVRNDISRNNLVTGSF
jgi:SpoVK/Ycf46/Vps4 family AAA+-type ATPase